MGADIAKGAKEGEAEHKPISLSPIFAVSRKYQISSIRDASLKKTTGNSTGRASVRRSASMEAASKNAPQPSSSSPLSSSAAAASASVFNPCDIASDLPPPLRLSREQLKNCSEALDFFKKKLRNPANISREFDWLQVFPSINSFSRFRLTRVAIWFHIAEYLNSNFL